MAKKKAKKKTEPRTPVLGPLLHIDKLSDLPELAIKDMKKLREADE